MHAYEHDDKAVFAADCKNCIYSFEAFQHFVDFFFLAFFPHLSFCSLNMKICLSWHFITPFLWSDRIAFRTLFPCTAQSTCNNLTQFFEFMFSYFVLYVSYIVQIKYPDKIDFNTFFFFFHILSVSVVRAENYKFNSV